MKHWLAVLAGLFLIVMGTGAAGTNVAFLLGIGLFGYNVAVLVSLALREAMQHLLGFFEAWQEWEPNTARVRYLTSAWYGRPEQYRLFSRGNNSTSQKRRLTNQPQTGQSLLEYALILALVFVVAVVGLALFGEGLAELFENTIGALRETFLG